MKQPQKSTKGTKRRRGSAEENDGADSYPRKAVCLFCDFCAFLRQNLLHLCVFAAHVTLKRLF